MSNGSSTVSVLVTQVSLMREELDQTRNVMMMVLKEMLQIAQTQADTTRELTAAFTTLVTASQIAGPGSSRVTTDDSEYQDWRKQVSDAAAGR